MNSYVVSIQSIVPTDFISTKSEDPAAGYVVSIQSIVPTDFISNSSEDPAAPPIALSTSGARREQDLSHERRLVRWQKNWLKYI